MESLQSKDNILSTAQDSGGARLNGWKTLSGSAEPVGLMSDFINVLAFKQDYRFVLNEDDVTAAQLSDPAGLLGAVLWQAEKLSRLAYTGDETMVQAGATLGLQFVEDSESSLGLRPILPVMDSRSALPLMIVDVIEEIYKHKQVYRNTASLDDLLASFKQDYEQGLIPVVASEPSRFPEPGMPG